MFICNYIIACEFTFSLTQKVLNSDFIIHGEITSIKLCEVQKYEEIQGDLSQHIQIGFRSIENILGNIEDEITINAYSVDFEYNSKQYNSSAGFRKSYLKLGDQYVAYLNKRGGKYYLSFQSNQSLEHIDLENGIIRDIGQGLEYILFSEKLNVIRDKSTAKLNDKLAEVESLFELDRGMVKSFPHSGFSYKPQKGEDLSSIAGKFNTRVSWLIEANFVVLSSHKWGENLVLFIPVQGVN
jgi:hypothetical protein